MKTKQLILLIALCLCSANLMAQNRVYCEIVERAFFAKKSIKVTIDFGQKREKGKASQTLVDDKGEMIVFNSKIDALNHMGNLGWNFLQAYTVVGGSDGSTSSEIHWLLYKDTSAGEDPYQGLITKESFKK